MLALNYQKVPTLEVFLQERIPEECFNELSDTKKDLIKRNILLSMFHLQNDREFREGINKIYPNDHPSYKMIVKPQEGLRTQMIEHVVLNRNYKLGLIKKIQQPNDFSMSQAGLPDSSFDEAKDCLKPSHRNEIRKKIRKLPISSPTPKHQDMVVAAATKAASTFLSKFVYRKLRFISDANRFEPNDLVHQLQIKVITTARWEYPFKSEVHITNCCKQSSRNIGINQISYWTTQKRGRLFQDEDGSNINRQILLTDNDVDTSNYNPTDKTDLAISYRNLQDHLSGKKLMAFRLLSLDETCTPFLTWANKKLSEDFEDLETLQKSLEWDDYYKLISSYTTLSSKKLTRFIEELKTKF